jgi:hypothetical protein
VSIIKVSHLSPPYECFLSLLDALALQLLQLN